MTDHWKPLLLLHGFLFTFIGGTVCVLGATRGHSGGMELLWILCVGVVCLVLALTPRKRRRDQPPSPEDDSQGC